MPPSPIPLNIFFHIILLVFLLLLTNHESQSAHPARRYNSRGNNNSGSRSSNTKYDRSISTFSDDGRLLQVEYGMEASHRGQSVLCLEMSIDDVVSFVCFAVVVDDDDEVGSGGDSNVMFHADKVHRIDDHCLLLTTGLSGDGRALAQATRLACQRFRLTHGETATVREIAVDIVAEMQHELTRMGGARPFGVTATVVGVDPLPSWRRVGTEQEDSDDVVYGPPRLFQSEPGGIVEEYTSCASGKCRKDAELALIKLRNKVLENFSGSSSTDEDNTTTGKRTTPPGSSSSSLNSDSVVQETVKGLANVAFEINKNVKKIDLWMVISDSQRRGHARIRCAKSICHDDVEDVMKLF